VWPRRGSATTSSIRQRVQGAERVLADRVLDVLEAEGDLPAWRALRGQPFHRDHPVEEVLHRFMGSNSGRKLRYASALVAILDPDELPRPLVEVVHAAAESR